MSVPAGTIIAAIQVANEILQAAAAARQGQTTPEQAALLRRSSELKLATAKAALAARKKK